MCYGNGMDAPKCRMCGKKHWSGQDCALVLSESTKEALREAIVPKEPHRPISLTSTEDKSVRPDIPPSQDTRKFHCPICKDDKSLLEDAEKWRAHREKRRLYMAKRRKQ